MSDRPRQEPKLIRDKVPAIMRAKGQGKHVITRICTDDAEYRDFLYRKLAEEAAEAQSATTRRDTATELGDVLEVIVAIAALEGVSMESVVVERRVKHNARGGYADRIIWYDDGAPTSAPGYDHG